MVLKDKGVDMNPYVCDWQSVENQAKTMTEASLFYAIADCVECIKYGLDRNGKYAGQIRVYNAEFNRRKPKPK